MLTDTLCLHIFIDMKKLLLILLVFVFAGTAFSSNSASANDTRKNAKQAYSELERPFKSTEKGSRNNSKLEYSKNKSSESSTSITKPIIMILPAVKGTGASSLQQISDNPFAKATMDGLSDYLAKGNYEIKSLEGSSELEHIIQMQNDIAGNDEDLAYLASLSLNADIFIKFSGSMDSKGFVTVELKAYESTTARLLGSQSSSIDSHGHTTAMDQQANLKAAAKKAMPSIEKQILAYWKESQKNGTQYKVIINITGEYGDSELEDLQDHVTDALKKQFNKVKVNSITSKTMDLVVYADPAQYEDVNEVYRTIRQATKGLVETKKQNITKKLIVMEMK